MDGRRRFTRVGGLLVIASILAGTAYAASSMSTKAAAPAPRPVEAGSPSSQQVAGSPELTELSSPWLGYTITLPTAWVFTGHVSPFDSDTPHDSFMGVVPGANARMMLVIGRSVSTSERAVDHTVTAGGTTFTEIPAADMGDGAIGLVAQATVDGTHWYIMASMPDSAAARAFFDRTVASFHISAPTSVESPSAE